MTKEKKKDLTTKQKKFLKGLAHHLKPVVQVGKEGITEQLIGAIETELTHHELIKLKIGQNSEASTTTVSEALATINDCYVVQVIGKTVVAFKTNLKLHKDIRIKIPKG